MPDKIAYLFVFDGFADWQPAHALCELRRSGGFTVRTVSLTGEKVVSMGGLGIQPDGGLEGVELDKATIFILPGGAKWLTEPVVPALREILRVLDKRGVPLAAICSATTVIARLGLFRGREHTSNSMEFLQNAVPEYDEADQYVEDLAVRDQGLITASGLGNIEFASEIFAELQVMEEDLRNNWEVIFRTAEIPADLTANN